MSDPGDVTVTELDDDELPPDPWRVSLPRMPRETWVYVGIALVLFDTIGFRQVYELVTYVDFPYNSQDYWISPLIRLVQLVLGGGLIWWGGSVDRRRPLVAAGLVLAGLGAVLEVAALIASTTVPDPSGSFG